MPPLLNRQTVNSFESNGEYNESLDDFRYGQPTIGCQM